MQNNSMVINKTSVCIFICIRCCWNECSQYVLHLFKAESMSLFLGLKHLWSPSLSQTHLLCLVTMVTSLHTADLIIYRTTPLWEMPNHIYILWLVSFCQGEECSWCHVVLAVLLFCSSGSTCFPREMSCNTFSYVFFMSSSYIFLS